MNSQRTTISLQALAAAIALTLGSAGAFAQEDLNEPQAPQSRQGTQQPGAQQSQPGAQQSREAQVGQQRSQAGQQESEARSSAAGQQDPQSQRSDAGAERSAAGQQQSGSAEIDQLAQQNSEISTFVEALKSTGMADALTDGTQYTLFAPTNDAFEQNADGSVEELMSPDNHDRLVSLLRAHIVADDVDPELAQSVGQAQTIDGGSVEIQAGGEEQALMVGDATAEGSPIQMGSLRVYVIDGVLESSSPDRAAEAADSEAQDDRIAAARGEGERSGEEDAAR